MRTFSWGNLATTRESYGVGLLLPCSAPTVGVGIVNGVAGVFGETIQILLKWKVPELPYR